MLRSGSQVRHRFQPEIGTGTVIRLWAAQSLLLVMFDRDELPREVTLVEIEAI
jgi:hypothetical protein